MTLPVPRLDDPYAVVDALLNQAMPPGRLRGVTDADLDEAYRRAYEALEAGRPEEALADAVFLVSNDPWQRHHLLALANCLQRLGQHEGAGRFYAEALVLDATDATCLYRIGECLGAMGALAEAREAYEAAIRLSWLQPKYVPVREQALRRLDELAAQGV